MAFNSFHFLIFFIFVLLATSIIRSGKYQHLLLLAGSYYFYWTSSNYLLLLLVSTSLITYYGGGEIYRTADPRRRKLFLILSTVCPLIILGFFKYFNFATDIVNQSAQILNIPVSIRTLNILLPIGISFYTFQALSYVFDIYRNKLEPAKSLYKYVLFVAFFPQLVSGPIVRASQFLPQLKNKIKITPENLKFGTTLMLWGFIKKIVIADNIAPAVDKIFADPQGFGSLYIIAATFLFGIQIYCDFSAYANIAIGAARIFGFHIPQNFNRPYFAQSPTEFWRRWHMTLSFYIRDYLYIPLGGNRKGTVRTYINLMISMLICGLWHGAAWNFVIWGGYHGILLVGHQILRRIRYIGKKLRVLPQTHLGTLVKILVTQYFIFFGWLIFRAESLSDVLYCAQKFILIDITIAHITPNIKIGLIIMSIILLLAIAVSLKKGLANLIARLLTMNWVSRITSLKLQYWLCYLFIAVLLLLCLSPSSSPEFIYFKF